MNIHDNSIMKIIAIYCYDIISLYDSYIFYFMLLYVLKFYVSTLSYVPMLVFDGIKLLLLV